MSVTAKGLNIIYIYVIDSRMLCTIVNKERHVISEKLIIIPSIKIYFGTE